MQVAAITGADGQMEMDDAVRHGRAAAAYSDDARGLAAGRLGDMDQGLGTDGIGKILFLIHGGPPLQTLTVVQ